MLTTRHKYDPLHRKDPKGAFDKLHFLDRIIDRNEALLHGSGSPMTLWKFFPFGPECECEKKSRCSICYGSGYINGYQRYGYHTYTYGSQSIGRDDQYGLNITPNIKVVPVPNSSNKAIILHQGASGSIETNYIPIKNSILHPYLKTQIFTPPGTSIMYSFTIDGINYTSIFDLNEPLDIPEAEYVKIRLTLSRQSITTPSPAVNVFRFRTQIKEDFKNYIRNRDKQSYERLFNYKSQTHEDRFEINGPAFLASKQYTNRSLSTTEHGHTLNYNPRYWALPDVKINERDIGMFLKGNHHGERFEFEKIQVSEYGEECRVLHTNWDSRFIVTEDDVLGIVYQLD